MDKIEKYMIERKLETITKLQQAYTLLLNDGDIAQFCDDNDLNLDMLLDLLAVDWSITLRDDIDEKTLKVKLTSPIEELALSTRTYNALKHAGIHSVSQLLGLSLKDLKQVKNLGNKGMNKVITQMHSYGITNWLHNTNI